MSFDHLDYQVKDRLAYITLDRPNKRNALNYDLITELKEAISYAENNNKVKVIILNANGKAFSAGADLASLQQLQENSYEENHLDSLHLMELLRLIYHLNKVVIAQIEGPAIAGGCGLTTVCDITFAVPDAKFGYTEVKIGFVPALVMKFLLRKVGETTAKELLLTGQIFKAKAAQSYGLINYVVSPEKIEEEVYNFGQKLCQKASGESLKRTKQMIAEIQSMNMNDALNYAAEHNAKSRATRDCKKGINAFLNKEELKW